MNRFIYLSILLAALWMSACAGADPAAPSREYIPEVPDYSDPLMWITQLNDSTGTGADIFYVPSTWEFDWTTPEGLICHYADPSLEQHRADMAIEMTGIAEYMAPGNNFYSPYYRHITLDTWATLDESLIESRYRPVSFEDVRNAFSYYIDHHNQGRPFILAGFSQGGKSVVELMKVLPPDRRHDMIAAYVMGYKVIPADTIAAPWIKGAQGPRDTGVTICYNSVSALQFIKPIVAEPNVMAINPVNWRTDNTPAILNDTITVTLDLGTNVLVVKGFDGSYLPNILDILNTGDYHGAEPWLYSDSLALNIRDRITAFRSR